ncbi:MAG: S8 family serine peptidase [Nanoarchaeota archaeon]|nr:S8 family serine peptidase [Nanoarchaeota archaeon]
MGNKRIQRKKGFVIVTAVLITALVLLSISFVSAAEIPQKIQDKIKEHGTSEVMVLLDSSKAKQEVISSLSDKFALEHEYSTFNGFSGVINKEGLKVLAENPDVKAIVEGRIYETLLDYSAPQIGATDVWDLTINSVNVTGEGETICVVDTGIYGEHEAFEGKIKAERCYCRIENDDGFPCCPNNEIEDDNAEDETGHGTHVAGIVAGDLPVYRGIAPGADIVAIKVCDQHGSCHGYDMVAGIDWCVTNAEEYNISAITMSIGGGLFSRYCDVNLPDFSAVINAAAAKNIPVTISAGNSYNTTSISSPACIEAAIPVGGVNDTDSIFYNRCSILDLLAPARGIISAAMGGGTVSKSGTSMATPHVAGSIILMKQFLKLQGEDVLSPAEFEAVLDETGLQLYDAPSGETYSRINVYDAILSLDDKGPEVEFTSSSAPDKGFMSENSAVSITSNEKLAQAWIQVNDANYSLAGSNTEWTIDLSFLESGSTYRYRVFGEDMAGNVGESGERAIIYRNPNPLNLTGDLNCDGSINFRDINPFVSALIGEVYYYFEHPNCNRANADCNHDGYANTGDVNPFVQLLTQNNNPSFQIVEKDGQLKDIKILESGQDVLNKKIRITSR